MLSLFNKLSPSLNICRNGEILASKFQLENFKVKFLGQKHAQKIGKHKMSSRNWAAKILRRIFFRDLD